MKDGSHTTNWADESGLTLTSSFESTMDADAKRKRKRTRRGRRGRRTHSRNESELPSVQEVSRAPKNLERSTERLEERKEILASMVEKCLKAATNRRASFMKSQINEKL